MAVRTDPEEARKNDAPGPGKHSPFVAPPSVRPHRSKPQKWGRGEETESTPIQPTVQPLLDRLAVNVGPVAEPVEQLQPPPPPPEPDPVVPPSPDVPEEQDDSVLLRVPKETLIRIIEEIVMSQQNQNQNTAKSNEKPQANADTAQANAEHVQAKVETPNGTATVDVNVGTTPAPTKASKWKQIGTHTGAALVGAGLAVGGYFLNRHLRGGASA